MISVNIGVPTLQFGGDHANEHEAATDQDHHHEGADPHTWMDVHNVEIWVDNIAAVLSAWAGLVRIGWSLPLTSADLLMAHGPLMVCGALMALSTDTLVIKRKPKVSYEP